MWCRLRALRDHGHLGMTVSVRASGVRAAGIGGGHVLPCECALCEELGQGVLGVDRSPWAVGSWWD